MPVSSFDDMDLAQLRACGISIEEVQHQLFLFQKPTHYVDLVLPFNTAFIGASLYNQVAVVAPGASSLGVLLSNGIDMVRAHASSSGVGPYHRAVVHAPGPPRRHQPVGPARAFAIMVP